MPPTSRLIAMAIAVASSVPLALAPATWAGDGGFASGQNLPAPQPTSIAAADFNNDGRADLVAAGDAGRRVEIFFQQANGGLVSRPPAEAGQRPELVAVGDFNRDGNDDLAVSDAAERDVKIRLGDGNGGFSPAPDVEIKKDVQSLVVGDFDADGRDDLAAATRNPSGAPHPVHVRLGDGDGRFPRGEDSGDGAAVLAVADFNSDTLQDLAFAGQPNYPNGNLLLGRGGGSFAPRAEITLPQRVGGPHGLAAADFNNDQKPDVVVALAKDATAVRLGAGDGGFTDGREVPTPGAPSAVAVGDFNSDGNQDFAVTDTSGSKTVHVRLGNGAGGFRSASDVTVGTRPVDIVVADYDSDGNDDLAVANADGSISVRTGTGPAPLLGNLLTNGGFEGPTPPAKVGPVSIPGWQLEGAITYARYGAPSSAYFPGRLVSPRWNGGGLMLSGGDSSATGGVTTVNQTVDVAASAATIDAGRSTANLSAYLGGAREYEDTMTVRAEFLSGTTSLGSFQIGPVTAADRNRQTTLLRRAAAQAVPAGTRQIKVSVISNDADKQRSSALADNVKLTLSTGDGRDGNTTNPPPRDRFGAKTLVTLKPSTRVKPRQAVRVVVRNQNGFAVSGRLGKRPLNVGARSASTLKVKLSAKQRRVLQRKRSVIVRLAAVVTDPAGESRRVTKRVRLRIKR